MGSFTIAQKLGFKNVARATLLSKATFNSSSSTASSGSTASTTDQRTQASRPLEATVQGKRGKDQSNEVCTAQTQVRKCRFLGWLLQWRLGKRGKRSIQKSPQQSLSSLFFALPTELQLEVINNLPLNDITSLQQTSQAFSHLVQNNEAHIVKQYIKRWMPKYISILFPIPTTDPATLKFLQDVTYRREVSNQLAELLARRIVKEMGQGVRMRRRSINPKVIEYVVERLESGFSPLILALFHFLETYHARKAQEISGTGPFDAGTLEDREFQIQSDIMSHYPDWLLLKVHQMYHLLLHLFTRRLTKQPFAFFRQIARWNHAQPGGIRPEDETFAKVILQGGIPEVLRIYKIKGQGQRRKALDKYIKMLDTQGQLEPPMKHHGGIIKAGVSINIDQLSRIWVPAAEKLILSRGIVQNLESIKCCGEFVAELLGEEFNSVDSRSVLSQDENAEDRAVNAEILAAMQWTSVSLRRLADDGSWDQNLIVEDEDEDHVEGKEKEGHGDKRPPTPPLPSKPVAGSSRSPGTIVGMTAPVPMASGIGYNGMGANFMTMSL
ncbi:hypothetical protein L211DRAFT_87214 [Terfezia boudieri ATCC MYA-4762]|uniref:F-box domain-containing protein n=1 Tax=Terfezia boudieri ATCC MYA-4762 TaxID=1051890 RepID=A0A3N4LV20_9PEZI|nr:hypothetical protein L211DRAFT_87214 [Terfezia boudieri ATCC MYA-4762]